MQNARFQRFNCLENSILAHWTPVFNVVEARADLIHDKLLDRLGSKHQRDETFPSEVSDSMLRGLEGKTGAVEVQGNRAATAR